MHIQVEQSEDESIPEIGIDCKLNSNNPIDRVASEQPKTKLSNYSQMVGVVATMEK
jgi:hypothetical protein